METNPTPTVKDSPKKAGATPERDEALVAMWSHLARVWKTNPGITLAYTTQADFETAATVQAGRQKARREAGIQRPQLSQRLNTIRDTFATALPYIKADLLKIYKKEGVEAAYPAFGIGLREGTWQFPEERLLAQESYDLLVTALAAQGLTSGDFGSAALAPLATEFRAKYGQLVQMDQETSEKVGYKNFGKAYLKKVTRSLRLVLEGNYPDTYEQMARAWGIHKEKFGKA